MIWWHYMIGYYFLCIVICVCIVLYNKNKEYNKDEWGLKEWIRLFVLGPLVLPIVSFVFGVSRIMEYQDARKMKQKLLAKKREFVAKYGFSSDEHFECFSMMGGTGVIACEECGYKEKIVSFIHGFRHSVTGRQCPKCYAFSKEQNVSDNDYSYGGPESDFLCPHCGTVIRKKDESMTKDDEKPLFCPKCHSHKLVYRCEYLT